MPGGNSGSCLQKPKIYSACVRSSMICGSETWTMKVEDKQKLERAEMMM